MIITIFGATGLVGKNLVQQALFAGYNVRAYGRNVHELIDDAERKENLEIIKGGLFDKSDVADAIKGADFVLSAIGGATDVTDNTRSLGMKYIVEAMEKNKVIRIVAVGGMGCLQADEDTLISETENFPDAYKTVTEEHLKALQYLRQSNLQWTFVCPPMITNESITGKYQTKADYTFESDTITAGDVAQFMLTEAVQNNFVNVKVGIGS